MAADGSDKGDADRNAGAEARRVSPAWRVMLSGLARLPQGALSRGAGRVADIPIPRAMRGAVLGAFARTVGIDLEEAELPLEAYGSIGEFFVRRLKPGARSWPTDSAVLASPVDGVLGRFGRIEAGRALQAKGRDYSVAELLGDGGEEGGGRYDGGLYVTIYLSPRHYHRIHAPCGGRIERARHVPGALLPVNAPAVASVPDLFARNERLVCWVEREAGAVAVVAVGAYNVGRISASFEGRDVAERRGTTPWRTNVRGAVGETRTYEPAIPVRIGDEIMAFHLGSTVVLAIEPGRAVLADGLVPGGEVRAGDPIARFTHDSERGTTT